jgi:hypothetical protein
VNADDEQPYRARVPANVDRPDQLLFRLTARQLGVLGVTGIVLWIAYTATAGLVPPLVFLGVAAVIVAVVVGVVLVRRDGLSLDAWLTAALRHHRAPHQLVPADRPVTPPPAWVAIAGSRQPVPAPLRLPARGIEVSGAVDLGSDGTAVLVQAGTVNFGLRSPGEQNGLVAGFARWLNSLDTPTQILIRARRVDLGVLADRIIAQAPSLPHPALEDAARRHAAFLDQLGADRELLHRHVLVAVRDPRDVRHAAGRAEQRAAEAVRGLAACEVPARPLDGPAAAAVLAECLQPDTPLEAPGDADALDSGDRR